MSNNKKRERPIIITNWPFRILAFIVFHIVIIVESIVFPLIFRMKIRGKRNLWKCGPAILISNHSTYLDPGIIARVIWPKRTYFSGLEETFKVPVLGFFVRLLGGFPIPDDQPMKIGRPIKNALKRNWCVHFFPEGVLYDYNQEINDYKEGAFLYALLNDVPIIPITTVINRQKIFGKDISKPFPKLTFHIGEPIKPENVLPEGLRRREQIAFLATHVREEMQSVIDENGGDKTIFKGKLSHKV